MDDGKHITNSRLSRSILILGIVLCCLAAVLFVKIYDLSANPDKTPLSSAKKHTVMKEQLRQISSAVIEPCLYHKKINEVEQTLKTAGFQQSEYYRDSDAYYRFTLNENIAVIEIQQQSTDKYTLTTPFVCEDTKIDFDMLNDFSVQYNFKKQNEVIKALSDQGMFPHDAFLKATAKFYNSDFYYEIDVPAHDGCPRFTGTLRLNFWEEHLMFCEFNSKKLESPT